MEPKTCWICFADETEDTPTTSRWRSPCPCALKAHESCLLDWIADLETPGNQPKPLICPQCKSKLVIRRPRSIVTDMVTTAQHVASEMTYPCVVATLAGSVIMAFWLHGLGTIYVVFGPRDANRVLGLDWPSSKLDSNWGLGMPFIPLALITSRTDTPNLDQIFWILSAGYFYSFRDSIATWPPSPSTTLAALGCILPSYQLLHRRYLTPLREKWLKEIKPRSGENSEADNEVRDDPDAQDAQGGMHVGIQLQIETEDEVEEGVDGDEQQPEEQRAQPPADAAAQVEEVLGQAGEGEQQPPAAEGPVGPQQRREHLFDIDLQAFGQKVVGALLFPTVAAAMGQALQMLLPRKWTTPPIRGLDRYPPGFLQSQFGRTVVGGCLFVVLKDALQMYASYHLAVSHRQRRVMNYDEIPAHLRKRLQG